MVDKHKLQIAAELKMAANEVLTREWVPWKPTLGQCCLIESRDGERPPLLPGQEDETAYQWLFDWSYLNSGGGVASFNDGFKTDTELAVKLRELAEGLEAGVIE